MRRTILAVCILAISAVGASAATGSFKNTPPSTSTADVFKVNYFSNANTANAPDGTFRMTNPGTVGGNICAYVLVHDPNQELSECCGCLLTPDGLRTLSVNTDLTANPLTGVKLTTGTIEVVSVQPVNNTCPLPGTTSAVQYLYPGLRAWGTHIQNSNFTITETQSLDATFSAAEDSRVYNECFAIVLDGSGAGICTCGTGD
jgi:hypothetical protein